MSRFPLFVLPLALLACGGGDDDPIAGDPDAGDTSTPDAGDDTPTPDARPNDPGLADAIESRVVGQYATKMVVATIQQIPVLGQTEGSNTSYGLSTIARDGDTFVLTETGCHVEAGSSGAVTTTIPDVIPRSTPPVESQLAFAEDGSDIVWSRAEVVTLVSVDLDDPANDALPTSGDDPRVSDLDDDSHPGVTVNIQGLASGDIYVVQRNRTSYGGTLVADGDLRGLVTDGSDQSVLGSTNPVLNTNIPTEQHGDPDRSTIVMKRVTGDWDCDRLMDELDTVLP